MDLVEMKETKSEQQTTESLTDKMGEMKAVQEKLKYAKANDSASWQGRIYSPVCFIECSGTHDNGVISQASVDVQGELHCDWSH